MSRKIFYSLYLLLIPLVGMALTDEIKWSIIGFIIMGFLLTLLGFGINFIINQSKNLKNRILYIGILVSIFLLIWAELAVGIIGTPLAGN